MRLSSKLSLLRLRVPEVPGFPGDSVSLLSMFSFLKNSSHVSLAVRFFVDTKIRGFGVETVLICCSFSFVYYLLEIRVYFFAALPFPTTSQKRNIKERNGAETAKKSRHIMSSAAEARAKERSRVKGGVMNGLGRLILYRDKPQEDEADPSAEPTHWSQVAFKTLEYVPPGIEAGIRLTKALRKSRVLIKEKGRTPIKAFVFARVEEGKKLPYCFRIVSVSFYVSVLFASSHWNAYITTFKQHCFFKESPPPTCNMCSPTRSRPATPPSWRASRTAQPIAARHTATWSRGTQRDCSRASLTRI